jgi:hypothetical protein
VRKRFNIDDQMNARQVKAQRDYLTLIPVDILEVIGAIVVNFASLEEALCRAIWFLITSPLEGVKTYHQSVTAELSYKQKVWMFANLLHERYAAPEEWVTDAKRKCFQAEEQRNAIIHSVWQTWFPLKPNAAARLKTRARGKKLVTIRFDHTHAELAEFARSLRLLGSELESAALLAFTESIRM